MGRIYGLHISDAVIVIHILKWICSHLLCLPLLTLVQFLPHCLELARRLPLPAQAFLCRLVKCISLGYYNLLKKDVEIAQGLLQSSIQLAPKRIAVFVQLAHLHIDQDNYPRAEQVVAPKINLLGRTESHFLQAITANLIICSWEFGSNTRTIYRYIPF